MNQNHWKTRYLNSVTGTRVRPKPRGNLAEKAAQMGHNSIASTIVYDHAPVEGPRDALDRTG